MISKLKNKESGIILYGFTPPKMKNSYERNMKISERRVERLKKINIDGVVIYDIQDESSRTDNERPFPFLPTLEPLDYYVNYLKYDIPPIIYQCVGKYTLSELNQKFNNVNDDIGIVLVGSPSKKEEVKTNLNEAYSKVQLNNNLLGGVVIPERHCKKGDEHLRVIKKQNYGCKYFISQCVYDAEKFKNMLSEYYYHCKNNDIEMVPIIMTITPCGSKKTVELLKWLGISIPKWIENDLDNSVETLKTSLELSKNIVKDVLNFCQNKNIPFGCNIESVSIKRDEVLASFELVNEVNEIFKNAGLI